MACFSASRISTHERRWAKPGFESIRLPLRRPIDVIAFNGGGATRVRMELARQDNAERLGHKKVIVYEFAIRNLQGESWKPISMVAPKSIPIATRPTAAPIPSISGKIRQKAIAGNTQQPDARSFEQSQESERPVDTPAENPRDRFPVPYGTGCRGRIIQTSKVPAPGTLYKDC
jgi:hypothetical protein